MKDKINISNYEEYVLDYLESNLDADQRQAFQSFLEANPAIREEIEDLLEYSLEPTAVVYEEKKKLKRRSIIFSGLPYGIYAIAFFIVLGGVGVILSNGILWNREETKNDIQLNKKSSKIAIDEKIVVLKDSLTTSTPKLAEETASASKNSYSDSIKVTSNKINQKKKLVPANQTEKKPKAPQRPADIQAPIKKEINKKGAIEKEKKSEVTIPDFSPIPIQPEVKSTEKPMASHDDEKVNIEDALKRKNTTLKALDPIEPNETAESAGVIAHVETNENLSDKLLNTLPDISIHIDEDDDEGFDIADNSSPSRKKRKFSLRGLIPESFGNLSTEDLKDSLVPTAIRTRK